MGFPSPGDLPDPRIKPASPALEGGLFTTEPPGKLRSLKGVGIWLLLKCDQPHLGNIKNNTSHDGTNHTG